MFTHQYQLSSEVIFECVFPLAGGQFLYDIKILLQRQEIGNLFTSVKLKLLLYGNVYINVDF